MADSSIDRFSNLTTDVIDVDWEYECGYEGGVNRKDSETEYQSESDEESDLDNHSLMGTLVILLGGHIPGRTGIS